ncbi:MULTISPECIES: glucosamine-6-phosphate deaminase [Trueperella]|uniref:Glucosamine-6-phosphate deaminase n=1 Tax=Trueperella bernardiae TaxID=59561 RepID=A0A0W1KL28_9ACTO|nr:MULTISPECIES: glucosamine-6-phosphate deaminase [Trueperella]KTF04335.1 Glucosamine-6-phosphate deaminase [Trueperella bernardiae]MCM3906775.1 glucosamine-6-phosphate deaminase [Trueperella bernardiae]MDK8601397.1 glucosamine-6-phosphate deaminase [Trueperella bernardiae]MDV6238081.1 glucosamine-6-phosphate deaminase [Trueperella bernardiae]OCW60754.1 glucosamine-6-phosphate deaminase [Trueperella bernardiae]
MQIGIFSDETELAKAAAAYLMNTMKGAEPKNLGVATGSTPLGLYAQLREAHATGDFTLADAKAFALDEYVGIDPAHPEAYRNVLRTELVGDEKTGLTEDNLHTPNGQADDPYAAAEAYDADIRDNGGVHLQILGIGANGHIGFNEPGVSLVSRTHVDALTHQTRKDNARFFEGNLDLVPDKCVTQGLGTIMEAKHLLLIALGENKADAIAGMVEGPISASCPASITQMHPSVVVFCDEAAASKLTNTDMYRTRWEVLK